jgi:hypothetical protein
VLILFNTGGVPADSVAKIRLIINNSELAMLNVINAVSKTIRRLLKDFEKAFWAVEAGNIMERP